MGGAGASNGREGSPGTLGASEAFEVEKEAKAFSAAEMMDEPERAGVFRVLML